MSELVRLPLSLSEALRAYVERHIIHRAVQVWSVSPDEVKRGVARNPPSGVSRVNGSLLRGPRGTVDRRSRHHERSPGEAGGVAPMPLSEGHGPHNSELRVLRDTDSSLRTAGARGVQRP
ncbi:hypothetical protein PC123_g26555 [Phytophthora cactorum]|nr:hypothetical protein PC123_g26555 [Phytophthora cactorum]